MCLNGVEWKVRRLNGVEWKVRRLNVFKWSRVEGKEVKGV